MFKLINPVPVTFASIVLTVVLIAAPEAPMPVAAVKLTSFANTCELLSVIDPVVAVKLTSPAPAKIAPNKISSTAVIDISAPVVLTEVT